MGLISNGTTIFDNGAYNVGGSMVLVSSATASSSASIEFSLGNYKEYQFYFVNIHPSVDGAHLTFNASIDNGSNYNVTKTTTWFFAYHNEADTDASLTYSIYNDLAQSTGFQILASDIGNGNDEDGCGSLHLFNPSSNVYVKHFISRCHSYNSNNYANDMNIAGYFNDTNDLTNIKFQMSSGNIDAGTILMYGVN